MIIFWLQAISTMLTAQVATGDHSVQFTIPTIAILDIEPNNAAIHLSFAPPNEAGNPITISESGSNGSKYLNYTSAIATGGSSRQVTVQLTSGAVPPGLLLRVQASTALAGGGGVKGVPAGLVNIGQTAKNLITGIGRCFTGDGTGYGHQLTYSIVIDDYGLLNFDANNTVQITYTISD